MLRACKNVVESGRVGSEERLLACEVGSSSARRQGRNDQLASMGSENARTG